MYLILIRLRYALEIVQHPKQSKACGWLEKDRKFLDPPPILKVKIFNLDNGQVTVNQVPHPMVEPFLMVTVHLWSEDEQKEVATVSKGMISTSFKHAL